MALVRVCGGEWKCENGSRKLASLSLLTLLLLAGCKTTAKYVSLSLFSAISTFLSILRVAQIGDFEEIARIKSPSLTEDFTV